MSSATSDPDIPLQLLITREQGFMRDFLFSWDDIWVNFQESVSSPEPTPTKVPEESDRHQRCVKKADTDARADSQGFIQL